MTDLSTTNHDEELQKLIEEKAARVRYNIIESLANAGSGHPGGSLSCADILCTLYFGGFVRVRPEDPEWPDRDRFVLSKGHAAPALYAVLAEKGFFQVSELLTLRKFGSRLQGHPDCRKTPGVEASTGSLGQGLSFAVGAALAARLDRKDYTVWVLLGDGECQEGQVWEAAMAAGHYRLGNLTAIVDHNHLQIDGRVEEVMSPVPLQDKFAAFGWDVVTVDGHNVRELVKVFRRAVAPREKPLAVIAETVKGRGVSYMENNKDWHGKAPKGEEVVRALDELNRVLSRL